MKTKSKREIQALEKEWQEMIALDPEAAAERYRNLLSMEADKRLDAITASGKGMMGAIEAERRYIAFSHDLAEVTGRRVYEVRRSIAERLGSDFLRREYLAMKRNALPAVEMPALAKQIIAALEFPRPKKIFEGEAEWQEHLRRHGLTEAKAGHLPETAAERRAQWQD